MGARQAWRRRVLKANHRRSLLGAIGLLVPWLAVSCSAQPSPPPPSLRGPVAVQAAAWNARDRGPLVTVSEVSVSRPLRDLPHAVTGDGRHWSAPGRNPFGIGTEGALDPVVQSLLPTASMPPKILDVLGQGTTLGGCIFPWPDAGQPSGCTSWGIPSDANGAVGPNDYVQIVNEGVAVWNKTGALIMPPTYTAWLFAGISTADGNHCQDAYGGDGVALYDGMADRWFVTQFDITNLYTNRSGPSYQCVAISQTPDPTGAYYLYDFEYVAALDDYGKFGVWQDAYYATFNDFDANGGFLDANVCAYDRASMLAGKPAAQQCFKLTNDFALLPASIDGPIKPPNGEPESFVSLTNAPGVNLYTFHVDWTTPSNSALNGPTALNVASYGPLCEATWTCVVQPSPGNQLMSLGDRPMFHLGYRNYGTVESLTFNHSVSVGSAGGLRWYEIQSPAGTPVIAQQGTYAPADGNYRGQGEAVVDDGMGVETGSFGNPPQMADRWTAGATTATWRSIRATTARSGTRPSFTPATASSTGTRASRLSSSRRARPTTSRSRFRDFAGGPKPEADRHRPVHGRDHECEGQRLRVRRSSS